VTGEAVKQAQAQVLRAADVWVAYPVRGWACKGCQFAHACKPKRPKLALVA
jgi:CRISPR/Cas system-associated exonuclease Cas4 (RecB family)